LVTYCVAPARAKAAEVTESAKSAVNAMLAVQAGACQAAVDCELVAPGVTDAEFRKWVSELHDLHDRDDRVVTDRSLSHETRSMKSSDHQSGQRL
jgi:hypothetical protein